MGKRLNLAELASEPILEARVPDLHVLTAPPTNVALHQIAANPLNPRENLGDLTELTESLRSIGQLQPCTAVTRTAYLAQYPEHEQAIGSAEYVAVTGGRRRAAAELAGLTTLDIVVKDAVAASRESLAAVAVTENIERRNFDVLEEARAVKMLVELCGSGSAAADQLSRTKGWVSQRLALLRLSAEMQRLLRAGDLPVRDARRLAQLDPAEQLAAWQAEQEAAASSLGFTAVNPSAENGQAASPKPPRQANVVSAAAVRRLGDTPAAIAEALRAHLSNEDLAELAHFLMASAESPTRH